MRILWVDPSAKEYLAEMSKDFYEFFCENTYEEAVARLSQFKFDLVILEMAVVSTDVFPYRISAEEKALNVRHLVKLIKGAYFEPLNTRSTPIIVYTDDLNHIKARFEGGISTVEMLDLNTDILFLKDRDMPSCLEMPIYLFSIGTN